MDAAAVGIPPQPKCPWPSSGGTKGCQLALATCGCWNRYQPPTIRKIPTMASLMITMAELKFADYLIPITRIVVITMTMQTATRLNNPVACGRISALTPGGSDMTCID